MASRGSVVRRRAASHRATQKRRANERALQSAYVSTYWQFKGYADSGSGPSSSGYYHNPGPRGGFRPGDNRNAPRYQSYATFTWYTPEAIAKNKGGSLTQPKEYFSRFTRHQAHSRRNDAATWRSISESYKTRAIQSELGSLQNIPLLKAFDSSSVGSQRGRSTGTTSQMSAMVSDGPGRPLKQVIINTAPSALQKVLLNNQGISTNPKAVSTPDWQKKHKTRTLSTKSQSILSSAVVSNASPNWALQNIVGFKGNSSKAGSGVMQSVRVEQVPDDTGKMFTVYRTNTNVPYGAAMNTFTNRDSASVEGIQNARHNAGEWFKDNTRDKTQDGLVKDELRLHEKVFKDEQRNIYLQNFAFGDGTLSVESSVGRDKKTPSLRNSKKGNLQMIKDKKEYNKQVAQFSADKMNLGLTDEQIHSRINTSKDDTKSNMKALGEFIQEYEHLKDNKNSSQAHRDKVSALNAKVKLQFPGIPVGGNSAQMIDKLTHRNTINQYSLTEINKQQDAMGLYMVKGRIIDRDVARGELKTLNTRADNKKRKADKRAADTAAAQKAFDELWREGAGQSMMSDTSVKNLNPERMLQAPSKSGELNRVVGIIKKYDEWDNRRSYIGGQLDSRRSNLNTYYNSNWEQDFTVSDTEASQYMFGSDTPSGTSLTRNAVTAIGINQRKPRKAIDSINKILAQTGENRSVYAENLAGIETKLLTLKEKQALKKAENDAIKARIAQQVTDDFNAGNVEINTKFRDNITGTSEELYDLNTQVAEHNTVKKYYDNSLIQTDEDTETLKKTLGEVIKVKKQNDYDTITSGADSGGNRSQSSLDGYNKSRRFKQRMVRSGGGKIQRTRSGRNLSGLVI